jgi:hypothetical protein
MRKIALIAALAAVGVPGAAVAAKPPHPATPSRSHANSHASPTSTIAVDSATKVGGTPTDGHIGIVKVRAAKNASAATLQTLTAFEVND